MKYFHTLLLSFLISYTVVGQNKIESTGNVGIGTTTPKYKLHVLDSNVPNSHYLKTANIFENTESRLQIIASDNHNASAMLFLSSAPESGNNKHWSFHHTGINRNDRLDIGYGTSSSDGDFWDLGTKMTILTKGSVGIGTTSPTENLSVFGNTSRLSVTGISGHSAIMLGNQDSLGVDNPAIIHAANGNLYFGGGTSWNRGGTLSTSMTISDNGNVGIGTTAPKYKLHVLSNSVPNGHYLNTANIFENTESRLQIIASDNHNASAMLFLSNAPESGDNKHWSFHHTGVLRNDRLEIGYSTSSANGDFWDTSSKMTIATNGDVGIGTTDTQGFKLGVNGKIAATEVKVALMNNWSDFVFYDDYKLPTLTEVEKHITEKGHLKDIPSAAEVAENGILLGDMNAKLLQKIEELTLYTIAQEKQIEKLTTENEATKLMQAQLQSLAKRLAELENAK